jgi:predicted phage terminase large subunit-like protein
MPDPQDYNDRTKTAYVCKPVHKLMIQFWEDIDAGRSLRSAMSVPPQTGKTTHTTILGVAWTMARRPQIKIMVGTYNENQARRNGMNIRRIFESERFREIFPEFKLEKGGKAKNFLTTPAGGYILMAGRGTGVTGNPCDIFIIDDPIKDQQEAQSTNALQEAWDWFSVTTTQRAHNLTAYVIIHTRWADNDLIGRICDPNHPDYDEDRARAWTYLNVKAYNNEPHIAYMMGIKPEDYIWPEKFSPELLQQIRMTMDEQAFSALYMGRPVPEEGGFFKKEMIQDCLPKEVPDLANLRVYAASDHAVSSKQTADYTVLLIVGIDDHDQMWILDVVREKMASDRTVEEMIRLMKTYRPITWWAARDHISQSIGPFLRKRMREEGVYITHVEDSPEIGNKMQKAQAIRGRMSMGMVRFNKHAHWYSPLVDELLRFRGEGDAYDDQVDAMGHIGRGLARMLTGAGSSAQNDNTAKPLTWGWVKGSLAAEKAAEAQQKAAQGW